MAFHNLTVPTLFVEPFAKHANTCMCDFFRLNNHVGGYHVDHSPLDVLTVSMVIDRFM